MVTWFWPNYCEENEGRYVNISIERLTFSDVPRIPMWFETESLIQLFSPCRNEIQGPGKIAGTILDKFEMFQKHRDGYLGFYFTEPVTLLWALCWYHRCQMFCPLFCGHPPLSPGIGLQTLPLFRVIFFFHNLIDSICCYPSTAFLRTFTNWKKKKNTKRHTKQPTTHKHNNRNGYKI